MTDYMTHGHDCPPERYETVNLREALLLFENAFSTTEILAEKDFCHYAHTKLREAVQIVTDALDNLDAESPYLRQDDSGMKP